MLSWEGSAQNAPGPGGRHRSPVLAIIATMLIVVGWLVFIIVYALAWSGNYSIFQNIVVTLASIAITGLLIGVMWVSWAYRRYGGFMQW